MRVDERRLSLYAGSPMDMVALQASARAKDAHIKQMRRAGHVPAIIYGNKADNILIHCEEVSLKKAYTKAGESTLVELDLGEKKLPVLFHAVDFDPVSDRFIHVDFYAVDMKKKVTAEVHIRFEGESPAVKEHGAILVTALHEVEVECLPADLPHDLAIDIAGLKEFRDTLTVANIIVPKGVKILTPAESVIAIAQQPREEEKVEEVVAPVAEGATAPAADGTTPTAGAPGTAAPADAKKDEGKKEKK